MIKNFSLFVSVLLVLVSCSKDNDNTPKDSGVIVGEGLLVINEGNYYSQIDGSLSYLDFALDTVANGVFKQKNKRSLGGTPNSGVICNGKLYIATTDDNRVEVLDARTLVASTPISIKSPRGLTAANGFVYVSSYTGKVSRIDSKTDKITAESDSIGACLEGIVAANGFVYVCNSYNPDYTYNTNIVKLNQDLAKVKDIQTVCNPNIIETDGTNLYVVSYGNYADISDKVQKIDVNDKMTELCNGVMVAYYDKKLYVVGQTYDTNWKAVNTYFVYDLQTNTTTTFNDGKDIDYPGNIIVNPKNGNVFITSYYLSEYGYGDYNSPGYLVKFDSKGKKLKKYDIGVGPKHFVLASN